MDDPLTLPLSLNDRLARLPSPDARLKWLAKHRLLGPSEILVARGLIPADLGHLAQAVTEKSPRVSAAQISEERRVVTALGTDRCRALVLKGCLLAHTVYSAPNQRWRADLDILVDSQSVAQSREILDRLGYRPLTSVQGGTPIPQETWSIGDPSSGKRSNGNRSNNTRQDRRFVDLHWMLRSHPLLRDRLGFNEQWERAIALPQLASEARGQCLVHALLNAAMHWFDRLYAEPRPLGWLLDIDLLWRALDTGEEDCLVDLAQEREISCLVLACLQMCQRLFETPIKPGLLDRLECSAQNELAGGLLKVDQSPLRAYWFALKCEPGWGGRVKRLKASLMPPAQYMYERYPERSKFGLLGLYARRIYQRSKQ